MYFSLLKIGSVEAAYWFGSKKKIELRNNFFVNPIFLITFSIIHGLVHFDESYFFWELEFSKFFLLFILAAFWLSCFRFYLYLRSFIEIITLLSYTPTNSSWHNKREFNKFRLP